MRKLARLRCGGCAATSEAAEAGGNGFPSMRGFQQDVLLGMGSCIKGWIDRRQR